MRYNLGEVIHLVSKREREKLLRLLVDYQAYNSASGLLVFGPTMAEIKLKDFLATVRALECMGLVELSSKDITLAEVKLTAKGACYFEIKRDETRIFIMKSIVIPILLSLATTLLVNYLLPSVIRPPASSQSISQPAQTPQPLQVESQS